MYIRKITLWLVFIFYWCKGDGVDVESLQNVRSEANTNQNTKENLKSTYSVLSESISIAVKNENLLHDTCNSDDNSCFGMDTNDKLGLEAIKALHHQLDDDRNGNVDLTETDDFLRAELQYDSGYERRQKAFHQNDDMHVSVKELWEAWLRSEVHNWTSQQTSEWLAISVELPQYVNNFLQHKINGAMLPRLAVNNMQLLSSLGIKDPIHKQKIALKAMDVVLFGPPKDHQPHWKDLTLIVLIIGGGIGMWYAVQQNKKFKNHLNRMNKDMEGLQHAESALENLQRELERAVEARENVVSEKQNLEKKLQEAGADSSSLHTSYSDLEVTQLKAEIEMLRNELQIAEGELKDRCWSPPLALQQWLQLTHEIENKSYIKKKVGAEKQLQQAREACEKLRKKRSSLVGAFVSTHGKSIDDVDRSIVEARTSLNEVTQELQERMYRWKHIEMLCGFNIINNSGLQQLENMLYRNTNINGRGMAGLKGRMNSSQDDLDDDTSSIYTATSGYIENLGQLSWREADSSGSEASKHEEEIAVEYRNPSRNAVQFVVGGETNQEEPITIVNKHVRVSSQPPSLRSISNNNLLSSLKSGNITRSFSQEVSVSAENLAIHPKGAQSETSLDRVVKQKSIKQQTIKEQPSISLEDDIYFTDSSLIEEDNKKHKRKLFGFSKKSKPKND
ncbi:hypothetical protein RN001_003073 [Aquatica leii]|uniref:SAM domain-containing protein n=1 Tax=Aquatica leii TaxID=1421715 RepID=A0AAN7SKI6_9COLE|nr:hypothetical protein RN001_003073 [Aquatica leii]